MIHPRMAAIVVTLVAAGSVSAAEVVQRVDWSEGPPGNSPAGVRLTVEPGAPGRLVVATTGDGTRTVPLTRIEAPRVGWPGWRIDGEVRVERLDGVGYAEMWVEYADGVRYFSRSQPWPAGGTGAIPFALPFRPDLSAPAPVALDIQLVLEGPTTLAVAPLRLVRVGEGENLMASVDGWWSERTSAVAGAVAGTVLGLLGALLGVMLARGVALRAVSSGLVAIALAGVVALAAAVVALATGQPYRVWYPLGLLGLIAAAMGFAMRPVAARRAAALEDQRMRAADL